jgi:chromosome segregation ATPase
MPGLKRSLSIQTKKRQSRCDEISLTITEARPFKRSGFMKPMTNLTRFETDQLRRLEELRKTFDKFRAERIRAEGEVERLSRELEEVRALALSEFGTDDDEQIQALIEDAQARNAKLADEFGTALREVETRLKQLGDER